MTTLFARGTTAMAAVVSLQSSTTFAFAHPGNHGHLGPVEAAAHFASLWHALPPLALAVAAIAGVLALERRRTRKARVAGVEGGERS